MRLFDVLVGAVMAGVIALVAWRLRTLTRWGAVAACVVGTLTYASGTIGFSLILLAFFVSSVVLSRVGRTRKRALVDIGKGGARDAMQVLANGGVATACAVGFGLTHHIGWAIAFAGAYAAATADTWATEIGTLAARPPRSIVSFRPLAAGMSGGITLPGTLAEIAGALWIGLVAPLGIFMAFAKADFGWSTSASPPQIVIFGLAAYAVIPIAGVVGATVDSLLGATAQELRRCEVCDRTCETDPHACGTATRLVRGARGVSNDVVNIAASAAGAAVALGLAAALPKLLA